MSIIDTRRLTHPARLDAEICIVGAGAAGITLANELAASGRDICLVESGGIEPDPDTQSLYDLDSIGYPLRQNHMSRAHYFGGSCNLWAGRCMTLNELDVQGRDWVADSGWPVAFANIAKYYPQAGRILRLPPMHQLSVDQLGRQMTLCEKKLFDNEHFVPTVSAWARSPMRFGSAFRSTLRRAHNVRLLLNASVTKINLNQVGTAVESVDAMTLTGSRLQIRARLFVLACGGLENARLLLVSRDSHVNGVANSYDAVGRYFMDHPRAVFGKVHLHPSSRLSMLRGRPLHDGKAQLGIGLSPQAQRREGLLNHYLTFELQSSGYTEARYQAFVQTMKILLRKGHAGSRADFRQMRLGDLPQMIYLLSPKELMPHFLYRWYVAVRDAIPRRPAPQTYVVVYFCEQPPDPQSRVTLSHDVDCFGVNRLVLKWRIGEEVGRSLLRLQQLLAQELPEKQIGWLEAPDEDVTYTDASHHMGTTRMSLNPKLGVVDADCKAHGVGNLFLAGSSVFPSAGHANPTLTIVALSLRLADHLRAMT